MQLKKKGLVFSVAYGWKEKERVPEKVSLCRLFWAFWKGLLIVWPGILLLMGVVFGLVFTVGILFGRRPTIFEDDEKKVGKSAVMMKYEYWPTIRGFRPLPIHLAIVYVVYVMGKTELPNFISGTRHMAITLGRFIVSSSGLIFWEVMLGISILLWLWFRFPKTEVGRVVVGFVKAKKDKICPQVEFI